MFPILYESRFVSIQTIWVFVVIALLTGSYLAVKRLKRARVNFNLFIGHSTPIVLAGVITSRVAYFLTHFDAYFPAFDLRTLKNFFAIWDHGLSLWGAFLGMLAMLTWRLWKAKEPIEKWYDALSVPTVVALIIGNLGALLGGYAYGTPSQLPWAVQYESFNVKYTVPVHPVQIYTILVLVASLLILKHLRNKTEFWQQDGNSSLFLIGFVSLGSIGLEFLRGSDTFMLFGLRFGIYIYTLTFLISSAWLLKRGNNKNLAETS